MNGAMARVEELLQKGKLNPAAIVLMNNIDQFSPEYIKKVNERTSGKNWATTNISIPTRCRNSDSRKTTLNM